MTNTSRIISEYYQYLQDTLNTLKQKAVRSFVVYYIVYSFQYDKTDLQATYYRSKSRCVILQLS
jgi:hypothetical protein